MEIRGIVICVNYDDLLNITLVRNMRHFTECVVVTSPTDTKTKELASSIPNVRVFETDAFYRYGAKFNKGLAMEEGFDFLGREGWICVWDADILFPDEMSLPNPRIGYLHSAPRLLLNNPSAWHPGFDWRHTMRTNDVNFPGYFHLFHADDEHLRERPWYDVTFAHAGGGDGYFQSRWPKTNKYWYNFNVLHLGPRDSNWFGRATPRVDNGTIEDQESHKREMDRYLDHKGWRWSPTPLVQTVKEFNERVEVPGHQPSSFNIGGRFDRPTLK